MSVNFIKIYELLLIEWLKQKNIKFVKTIKIKISN